MTDPVDDTQNPLIPPPKEEKLSQADAEKFKQMMKELSTDTEQKGKWKPQKDDTSDDTAISEPESTDDTVSPLTDEDNELGATSQTGSSAASKTGAAAGAQAPTGGAPAAAAPGEAKAVPTQQPEEAPALKKGEPAPEPSAPISLTKTDGGHPLSKVTLDAHSGIAKTEKGTLIKAEKTEKEEAAPTDVQGIPLAVPASQDTTIIPEKQKEKVKMASGHTPADMGTQLPPQQLPPAIPLTSLAPASYTQMLPQIQEFFNKLVGVLTVMKAAGLSRTVIQLNAPEESRLSIFNGSEIIIEESADAPKNFNIQFNGNPEAVTLVQGNLANLMAALQDSSYAFKVHRFEIGHLSTKERPLFKRKDAISGDDVG